MNLIFLQIMVARYLVVFKCGDNEYHTAGESSFPTFEQYSTGEYSKRKAYEVALSFVEGYLDAKGLLGKIKPTSIRYSIDFH